MVKFGVKGFHKVICVVDGNKLVPCPVGLDGVDGKTFTQLGLLLEELDAVGFGRVLVIFFTTGLVGSVLDDQPRDIINIDVFVVVVAVVEGELPCGFLGGEGISGPVSDHGLAGDGTLVASLGRGRRGGRIGRCR